jgi:hypothetical protein
MTQEKLSSAVRYIKRMLGRPSPTEAAGYFFRYIDLIPGDDPKSALIEQLESLPRALAGVSEEKSLCRYAPGKWSIREVLNHVTDTERAFAYRALWFSRGFSEPLIAYDQETAAAGAHADRVHFAAHLDEFLHVRHATLALFANMPPEGWTRGGIVSGNYVTPRALAFIAAGHAAHHLHIIEERYLA